MSESELEQGVRVSPPWGRNTKTVVVIIGLLLFALLAYRFQSLIAQLTIAAILAYLLNPIVAFVNRRVPVRRSIVIAILYLAVAAFSIWAIIALSVATIQQAINLLNQLPTLIEQSSTMLTDLMERTEPITIGPFPIYTTGLPWDQLTSQFLGLIEPAIASGTVIVRQAATTTVVTVLNVIFIFFLSLYIAMEIPKIGEHVAKAAQQPGYRYDAERLMREFGRIWSSYSAWSGYGWLSHRVFGLAVADHLGVQNALALGFAVRPAGVYSLPGAGDWGNRGCWRGLLPTHQRRLGWKRGSLPCWCWPSWPLCSKSRAICSCRALWEMPWTYTQFW
jgi:predicted PurR-regulated permease PerM